MITKITDAQEVFGFATQVVLLDQSLFQFLFMRDQVLLDDYTTTIDKIESFQQLIQSTVFNLL